MSNPFSGLLLNGIFFQYVEDSYSRTRRIKNNSDITQTSKTFSALGLDFPIHTVTLSLNNIYSTFDPVTNNMSTGTTTNLGLSQLALLENSVLNAQGASLPITMVSPYGTTHLVVPTGSVDSNFAFGTPRENGVEWRVSLTLEDIQ